MSDTYKPGDTVPTTGEVKCTQHNGVKDKVTAPAEFAPCDHWGGGENTTAKNARGNTSEAEPAPPRPSCCWVIRGPRLRCQALTASRSAAATMSAQRGPNPPRPQVHRRAGSAAPPAADPARRCMTPPTGGASHHRTHGASGPRCIRTVRTEGASRRWCIRTPRTEVHQAKGHPHPAPQVHRAQHSPVHPAPSTRDTSHPTTTCPRDPAPGSVPSVTLASRRKPASRAVSLDSPP